MPFMLSLAVFDHWVQPLLVFLIDRKSTRLNSSHLVISYAVFCLKKKQGHRPPMPHARHVCPRGPGGRCRAGALASVAVWRVWRAGRGRALPCCLLPFFFLT